MTENENGELSEPIPLKDESEHGFFASAPASGIEDESGQSKSSVWDEVNSDSVSSLGKEPALESSPDAPNVDDADGAESSIDSTQSITCDICRATFDPRSVDLEEIELVNIDKFHCENCQMEHGPSIPKKMIHRHRHEFWNAADTSPQVQNGTLDFIERLKATRFDDAYEIMNVFEDGHQVSVDTLEVCFDAPILVNDAEGLGLEISDDVRDLEGLSTFVEPDYPVDVIDVQRQQSIRCTFEKFMKNFKQEDRLTQLNLISLEFNDTRLSEKVELPRVVRELAWALRYWPKQDPNTGHPQNMKLSKFQPKVSKFCLISMPNAYTDFHIDFTGTSVWYHVVKGEKIFYFVKPTAENLYRFEGWMNEPKSTDKFFADIEGVETWQFSLLPGQTLLIPSGWIHAVLTPVESLVYGGNFLNNLSVTMQLKVYEMESRLKTSDSFKFPNFELACCFAANGICQLIRDCNEMQMGAKSYLISGAKALVNAILKWAQSLNLEELLSESLSLSELTSELSKAVILNQKLDPAMRQQRRKRKPKKFEDFMETNAVPSSPPVKRSDPMQASPEPAEPGCSSVSDSNMASSLVNSILEALKEQCQSSSMARSDLPTQVPIYPQSLNVPPQPLVYDSMCLTCKIAFPSEEHLTRHNNFVHSIKAFDCEECTFSSKSKKSLLNHIRTIHRNKGHACPDCGKLFKCPADLRRHVPVHAASDADRTFFTCTWCEAKFTQKSSCTDHEKSVHWGQIFTCMECNKSYNRKSYLTKHMKIHERDALGAHIVARKCRFCDYRTTNDSHMKRHEIAKHTKKTVAGKIEYCETVVERDTPVEP